MDNPQPEIKWTQPLRYCGPDDKPCSRMIGSVDILGVAFHVNAEQVIDADTGGDDREQQPISDDTYFEEITNLVDGEGRTVTFEGREYLLAISPFQR